jgi:Glycosyltransferase family 87
MAHRAITILGIALAACLYLLTFAYGRQAIFRGNNVDFSCFYRAGEMVLAGEGSRVYDLKLEQEFDDHLRAKIVPPGVKFYSRPFIFTPPSLLLFAPLAMFSYSHAQWAWFLLNAGTLILVPLVLARELDLSTDASFFSILFPVLIIPTVLTLLHGQVSIVIMALLTAVFVALRRGHNLSAGIWLALATIKPQLVLPAVIAFLVARNWKLLASFGSSCCCLIALSFALVGRHAMLTLPANILSYSRLSVEQNGEFATIMTTLRGLVCCFLPPSPERTLFLVVISALCLAIVCLAYRHRAGNSAFALLLVGTLLVGYHSYAHDMVLLIPLFPILCAEVATKGWNWSRGAIALGLTALVLAPFFPGGLAPMTIYYSLVMIGLLVPLYKESCYERSIDTHPGRRLVGYCGWRVVLIGDGPPEHSSLNARN